MGEMGAPGRLSHPLYSARTSNTLITPRGEQRGGGRDGLGAGAVETRGGVNQPHCRPAVPVQGQSGVVKQTQHLIGPFPSHFPSSPFPQSPAPLRFPQSGPHSSESGAGPRPRPPPSPQPCVGSGWKAAAGSDLTSRPIIIPLSSVKLGPEAGTERYSHPAGDPRLRPRAREAAASAACVSITARPRGDVQHRMAHSLHHHQPQALIMPPALGRQGRPHTDSL